MLTKNVNILFSVILLLTVFSGCSSYMHGYTKRKSFDRYLLVDAENENFGFQRITYVRGFRSPIDGFVEKHGLPDFIYEFEQNGREGIKMYYTDRNTAYIFVENSRNPNSIYLSEHRKLSDYEQSTYAELLRTQ